MRAQDLAEIAAWGWPDPGEALRKSVESSTWSLTVRVGGKMACVFGLARGGTLLAPQGVPWLLGTDVVARSGRVLQRLGPAYIEAMLLEYPTLRNYVHARNTVSLRWLKRLGFVFGEPFPHAATGELFVPFSRSR